MDVKLIQQCLARQQGQAMPLGIAFIMFVSLATILLYNSSQLVSKKSHIANAADAAVYSGLVWQARALNFQAYTNRAMVANQVSIAQFVSLNSWTIYAEISARNADSTIGWIPPVKPFTAGALSAATQINNIVGKIADVAVGIISGLNKALSIMQQTVYYSTFAITPSIVNEVAKETDPQYDTESKYSLAATGLNIIDWQGFTKKYDDDDLTRKVDIINRSRDRFTANRGWDVGRISLFPIRVHLIKEGMTHLVEKDGEWAWRGKDTLSLHQWNFRCKWSGCKWKHREFPIGWGSAYATDNIHCEKNCPTFERSNRWSGRLANYESEKISGYRGVNPFFDLADLSKNNKDPRLVLRTEVFAPRTALETSSQKKIGSPKDPTSKTENEAFGQGMFKLSDNLAENEMASMSSAEVYFERPIFNGKNILRVKGREKLEYGSLWNPYWQVRLISTPKEHRIAAWTIRENKLFTDGAGGAIGGVNSYIDTQNDELTELVDLAQYTAEEVAQLPDRLTKQVTAVNDLKNIQSSLSSSEQKIDALTKNVTEGEQAVVSAKDKINNFNKEIKDYKNALAATVDTSQRDTIENRIDQLEQTKRTLQAQVDNKQLEIDSLKDSISSEREIVNSFRQQGIELAGDLNLLDRQIETAQDLAPLIDDADQLIKDTKLAIDNADTQTAEDYLQEVTGINLPGDAIKKRADKLIKDGLREVEGEVKNAIKDYVKDAAEGIVRGFISDQGYDVDQLEKYAQDTQNELADTKAQFEQTAEDYITPLQDHLSELKASRDKVANQMQADLDQALVEMNKDIQYYKEALGAELNNATIAIQPKIDALRVQKQEATTQLERNEIDKQITKLETDLNQEINTINQSTGSTLNALLRQKQKVEADFNNKLAAAKKAIDDDIAGLERKIASLKDSVKSG